MSIVFYWLNTSAVKNGSKMLLCGSCGAARIAKKDVIADLHVFLNSPTYFLVPEAAVSAKRCCVIQWCRIAIQ